MFQSYKPTRLVADYVLKKQLHGGYKIIEYFRFSNESVLRKRTLYKSLSLSDAENTLYKLEKNLRKTN